MNECPRVCARYHGGVGSARNTTANECAEHGEDAGEFPRTGVDTLERERKACRVHVSDTARHSVGVDVYQRRRNGQSPDGLLFKNVPLRQPYEPGSVTVHEQPTGNEEVIVVIATDRGALLEHMSAPSAPNKFTQQMFVAHRPTAFSLILPTCIYHGSLPQATRRPQFARHFRRTHSLRWKSHVYPRSSVIRFGAAHPFHVTFTLYTTYSRRKSHAQIPHLANRVDVTVELVDSANCVLMAPIPFPVRSLRRQYRRLAQDASVTCHLDTRRVRRTKIIIAPHTANASAARWSPTTLILNNSPPLSLSFDLLLRYRILATPSPSC
ncbi:hypothetical protein GGX14DRAFT_561329 [Mycena pura]|uniref:Uncharacterized protein n=1 Tax=Mycena pura TaxID=153505 RepID=A0AAD6VS33_9AGAR|nr:hypothetical protein GGX14DRAFT_561329 [Mycena pura]